MNRPCACVDSMGGCGAFDENEAFIDQPSGSDEGGTCLDEYDDFCDCYEADKDAEDEETE